MKRTLVRYTAKAEQADENQRLIEKVFEELRAKALPGVRYTVLRVGNAFVHFAASEGDGPNPLTGLDAFKAFQSGVRERCQEPPQAAEPVIVGNYRMLDE